MSASGKSVVVVGAGVAGLTAAALLQKRGASVTLLESHALPGGCAGWFRKGEYSFAVGATIATGFESGGIHDRVYRELGLEPGFRELPFCYDVDLPGRSVRVHNDRALWAEELRRHFGASGGALERFWSRVTSVAKATRQASAGLPAMPVQSVRDLIDLGVSGLANPGSVRALPSFGTTVDEALEAAEMRDEEHRTMCRAQILDAMQSDTTECPFPNGALALDIYRYGCQYVAGGLGRVSRDLLQSFVKSGGRALFRRPAVQLEIEHGRVVGVRDEKGEVHLGEVLCAVPADGAAKLLPTELRPLLDERAKRAEKGWGAFVLYLAVDGRALQGEPPPFVMAVGDNGRPLDEGNSIFISTSPSWDTTRAPVGKHAVTISTHTDAAAWWALTPEDYAARRDALTREMLALADRAVPGLSGAVERLMPATPRTFERFTRRPLGRVGGVPQTMETANFRALGHRGELPGLWHAGDCVFPGQGAVGVTLGAMIAARSMGRTLGL